MAPHALDDIPASRGNGLQVNGFDQKHQSRLVNGIHSQVSKVDSNRSFLRASSPEEVDDLVGVGFGPASLAVAVALHDALEASPSPPELSNLNGTPPKVRFIERQSGFAWHAGMLLPGAKMQITFIKDMATLRNPRSEFTFLNYLHKHDRLVQFTNLGTFLPQRIEYEDYMRWCAGWFNEVVEYGHEVVEILPAKGGSTKDPVTQFLITLRNRETDELVQRTARHVLIAAGGKPNIPKSLPQAHPRVIHSSQYSHLIPQILTERENPYRISVIGGGQSAAEIFSNLHSEYPNSTITLLIRGSALRPSDDSPFVNEIFNPERVDDIYHQSPEKRTASIAQDRATNYGVVRLELLEHIYEMLYTQRIRDPNESTWRLRIQPYRTVTHIDDCSSIPDGVRLHVRNASGEFMAHQESGNETLDADVVLVATGYRRDAHETILKGMRHLMPGGDREGKTWEVDRDYRVRFEPGTVSDNAGIWLQGCNENTHGLSDTLLSIQATRAGETVRSIFGNRKGSSSSSL